MFTFGTVTAGTLDEATNTLSFTDGAFFYEGTISEDKSVSGTVAESFGSPALTTFSLTYSVPNGNR